VVIAWNQDAGTTQYDIGSSTDLAVSPTIATVTWIKQDGVSGISYAKGSNTGFIAVDGVTVEKTSVTVDKLSFTDLSTLQLMYNGTPQGIGNVTAAAGFTLGAITVYYTGTNTTTYVKSTTAPTNAGTYQVTADVAGNVNYEAASNLVLGEYTIAKASVSGVARTYQVLVNSAQTYTFDLTSLLPSGVDASQVSYTLASNTNTNSIFSGTPSVSDTTLTLPVASVGTSGLSDTVTIGFTSDNYNISGAVVTVETVDKTPVTITASMTGGVYNGQPYAYSNAAVTANSDNSDITGSITLGVSYMGINGTTYGPSSDAPTNAGSYQLTLSVPDSDATYTGSTSYNFTIGKRPITIKADNKSMTKGGALPALTCTLDGQLSGETALSREPALNCSANGTAAGSFDITVFMMGTTYNDNYMAADPAYVNGTLTVNNPSTGGNTGGGGSSTPATPAPTVSGSTATTTVTAKTGSDGKAAASVTQSQVNSAIEKAQKAAKNNGAAPKVEIQVSGVSNASTTETTLPKAGVQALVTGKMESMTLSSPVATMTFDAKAIAAIAGAASGNVSFTVSNVKNSTLSGAAQQVVGDRPVYNLSVTSGGSSISQFDGTVTVSLPYTPAAGEGPDAIVAYYINADGEPELMQNCHYDAEAGALVFTTTHFSTYAVGYNKIAFSDVSDSAWYADAVSYLAAREITSGTTETTFSADATLTRGQFITLLMRAYGIEPDESSADNFTDAGNTYYTGYLAAAKRMGISNGVGDNKFAPDQAITRQDMFTLLYNALKVLDKLPEGDSGKVLSDFTDGGNVSSYAQEALTYLVKTGTVGGNNGQLNPTDTTTRAQMVQVLYNLLSK
ncbi:MAG: S-layer homology domain-containing protein, partial [Oscillospiraceae bacterium]|nr:S-layer homology domain-containing protein [Oscillospiraceae bacterium]